MPNVFFQLGIIIMPLIVITTQIDCNQDEWYQFTMSIGNGMTIQNITILILRHEIEINPVIRWRITFQCQINQVNQLNSYLGFDGQSSNSNLEIVNGTGYPNVKEFLINRSNI